MKKFAYISTFLFVFSIVLNFMSRLGDAPFIPNGTFITERYRLLKLEPYTRTRSMIVFSVNHGKVEFQQNIIIHDAAVSEKALFHVQGTISNCVGNVCDLTEKITALDHAKTTELFYNSKYFDLLRKSLTSTSLHSKIELTKINNNSFLASYQYDDHYESYIYAKP